MKITDLRYAFPQITEENVGKIRHAVLQMQSEVRDSKEGTVKHEWHDVPTVTDGETK